MQHGKNVQFGLHSIESLQPVKPGYVSAYRGQIITSALSQVPLSRDDQYTAISTCPPSGSSPVLSPLTVMSPVPQEMDLSTYKSVPDTMTGSHQGALLIPKSSEGHWHQPVNMASNIQHEMLMRAWKEQASNFMRNHSDGKQSSADTYCNSPVNLTSNVRTDNNTSSYSYNFLPQ